MDVRFCEGRNPCREAHVRAVSFRTVVLRALPNAPGEVRVPLDKDLHGCRQTAKWSVKLPRNRLVGNVRDCSKAKAQSGHGSSIVAASPFARIMGNSVSVPSRSRGMISLTTRCCASRFACNRA